MWLWLAVGNTAGVVVVAVGNTACVVVVVSSW